MEGKFGAASRDAFTFDGGRSRGTVPLTHGEEFVNAAGRTLMCFKFSSGETIGHTVELVIRDRARSIIFDRARD